MIFIVVKHPVRPEYADDWPFLVDGIFHRYPSRTGEHLLRLVQKRRPTPTCGYWSRHLLMPRRDGHTSGSAQFKAAIASLPKWLADVPEIVHAEVPGESLARMSEVKIDVSCSHPSAALPAVPACAPLGGQAQH